MSRVQLGVNAPHLPENARHLPGVPVFSSKLLAAQPASVHHARAATPATAEPSLGQTLAESDGQVPRTLDRRSVMAEAAARHGR